MALGLLQGSQVQPRLSPGKQQAAFMASWKVYPHPLASPAQGSDWLYLLGHAQPEKGRAWGSILPEAAFRLGVKDDGCFPGDELGCAWGPLQ